MFPFYLRLHCTLLSEGRPRNCESQNLSSALQFLPEVCYVWRNGHETYFGKAIRKWHKENKLQSASAENLWGRGMGRGRKIARPSNLLERCQRSSATDIYLPAPRHRCYRWCQLNYIILQLHLARLLRNENFKFRLSFSLLSCTNRDFIFIYWTVVFITKIYLSSYFADKYI